MQTHIALATDSHTEGTMTEHLDADLLATGPTDMLSLHLTEDLGHLRHIQFSRQNHHIGKLGIEAKGLDV